jgi:erythromycin esterase
VLLGESTHGTHEFYTWRTAISKKLIMEKKFNFIAVEGDWPDCYKVNRFIKGYDFQDMTAAQLLSTFDRWPTWMWANWETVALVEWLKDYNKTQKPGEKIGFYGLDVYSLWESLETLVDYLGKNDPSTAKIAEKAILCFERFGKDEFNYMRHAVPDDCVDEVIYLLKRIRENARHYNTDPEASLNTSQNAHIAVEAEKYYRSQVNFDKSSWNIRDKHMLETLKRIMHFHGPKAKGIVWEHNTHIGDARYTDMKAAGMWNTGQLAREEYGEEDVMLVGFGTYTGEVMAGKAWSAPMEKMKLPEARKGSLEETLHSESADNRLMIFNKSEHERFGKPFPHRAVGVVFHPHYEFQNYVPSLVNARYDAFVYIDQSSAVHPLKVKSNVHEAPSTYPFEF